MKPQCIVPVDNAPTYLKKIMIIFKYCDDSSSPEKTKKLEGALKFKGRSVATCAQPR